MQAISFWCEVTSYAGGFKVTAGNTEEEVGATIICATRDQVLALLIEKLTEDVTGHLSDQIIAPTLRKASPA
jgi:hypothetical protein